MPTRIPVTPLGEVECPKSVLAQALCQTAIATLAALRRRSLA
ncbi:MAG TPA: hypothetical protein VGM47_11465 [Gammaproteobacteria bacterium]